MGILHIPLDDIGVVLPVESTRLADSNGYVTVWLRNGSELRGQWADPELEIGVEVGGEVVGVELPMDPLQAIQTQGTEIWPDHDVYRVRTTHGDDFLVDPDRTQIVLENDLGVFAPFLSECLSAAPMGPSSGDWRIELDTGTVLVGPLADDALVFALPMGPESVAVPLELFVSMEREYWAPVPTPADKLFYGSGVSSADEPARPRATPALSSEDGWFDYRGQWEAKH
ncbi:MAG: hypothetical protein JRI25_07690 [Deltaproteobacteria bacterium]|nr:hypothetical protein [Deltaproteobacteria bacterium]